MSPAYITKHCSCETQTPQNEIDRFMCKPTINKITKPSSHIGVLTSLLANNNNVTGVSSSHYVTGSWERQLLVVYVMK